jgi:hypothetical protein
MEPPIAEILEKKEAGQLLEKNHNLPMNNHLIFFCIKLISIISGHLFFKIKIGSSIDHTTYKYHCSSIEDELNLALHILADLVAEIIEYEKPSTMFSALIHGSFTLCRK